MHASEKTWDFKTTVIAALESSGLGYDTRYRYYQQQFPEMTANELARKICDPIEYYDKDLPAYLSQHGAQKSEEELVAEFMFERDKRFRDEALIAICCYDEAGFGSGLNAMRFVHDRKPILAFYNPGLKQSGLNIPNILQLKIEYPDLVTMRPYASVDELPDVIFDYINNAFKLDDQ